MTFALATLVFLATLWMLVVTGAALLERSGGKMLSALRGDAPFAPLATVPVRVRTRHPQQATVRARPRLRAAA